MYHCKPWRDKGAARYGGTEVRRRRGAEVARYGGSEIRSGRYGDSKVLYCFTKIYVWVVDEILPRVVYWIFEK